MLVTNRAVDDPRVCVEAEALARRGYALTVIGWDRDVDKDSRAHRNGVEFVRLSVRSTHGRGITQPLFLGRFWGRAWGVLRRLRPDVIHCHDLDTLPAGWRAAGSLRARLVFDAHENYPDMMAGHLPARAVNALRALERWLVRRCDLLITVGNRLAEHYRNMGAPEVCVVGNWKDPADFEFPPETIARTRRELGLRDGTIAICFIANLGPERRLEPLLKAVAGDDRFACVIGGDGPQAELAGQYADRNDNIVYLGRVAPERVPLVTAACDVVYCGYDEQNPHAHWGAPNKLYEAIAAGKPILSGDYGELGEIVRDQECGILCDTRTPEGITNGLSKLVRHEELTVMGSRAGALQDNLSGKEAERHLSNAYAQLLSSRSARATPGHLDEQPC